MKAEDTKNLIVGQAVVWHIGPDLPGTVKAIEPRAVVVAFGPGNEYRFGRRDNHRLDLLEATGPGRCSVCGQPEVEHPYSEKMGWQPPLMCCAFGQKKSTDR